MGPSSAAGASGTNGSDCSADGKRRTAGGVGAGPGSAASSCVADGCRDGAPLTLPQGPQQLGSTAAAQQDGAEHVRQFRRPAHPHWVHTSTVDSRTNSRVTVISLALVPNGSFGWRIAPASGSPVTSRAFEPERIRRSIRSVGTTGTGTWAQRAQPDFFSQAPPADALRPHGPRQAEGLAQSIRPARPGPRLRHAPALACRRQPATVAGLQDRLC